MRRFRDYASFAVIAAAVAVAIPHYADAAAAAADKLAGTWNFVPARSKSTAGALPFKSLTLTFSGSGEMVEKGVADNGDPIQATYQVVPDNQSHPVTGVSAYDAGVYTPFGDSTITYRYTKRGANVVLGSRVISADGNVLTFSEKTYTAAGKELSTTNLVFAKPGFELASAAPPGAAPPPAAAPPPPPVRKGDTADEKAALAALDAGNDDQAIALYTKAIDSNAADVDIHYAHVARGIAYARQKKNEMAVADFDAALKLMPDDADANFRRGGVLLEMKQYDPAIESLSKAISLDDKNATAYFLRGFAYLTLMKDKEGAADKDKACMLDMMFCNN